jgi:AraC family transcriptional activator of pobA
VYEFTVSAGVSKLPIAPRIMTLAQWAGGAPWVLELPHSIEDHALIWQTKGQARCVIDGLLRGIGAHTALAIPSGSMFSYEHTPQGFGLVCLIPSGGELLMPDTTTLLRIRDQHLQVELTGLIEAMQREQNSDRAFLDEALMAQGSLLTVWLRRAIIASSDIQPRLTAAERLSQAFVALIERDFRTGQSMADYAKHLGVTPTHLTRVCKQSAGQTASQLLTGRVLHAARTELETGTLPIMQIAANLGFNSGGYFSRFIQHHTGSSPSNLRKQAQAGAQIMAH